MCFSRVRPDHPRCRSATWICMCGHTCDPVIYSKFHRNPFRSFGAPGGRNLAFPITLAIRFYNSLSTVQAVTSRDKVDVLHVRLTELHAAHQNLPPAICTLQKRKPYKIYTENERHLAVLVRTYNGSWAKFRLNSGRDIVIVIFFKMAATAILGFQNVNFSIERSRGWNCITAPNFVEIVPTAAEPW